ncbi:dosage compensation protein dpy-30 [Copidosoma floridanum]|uniref:dosage compensation protein dpy-30 n=1 Tax=Copidosoma floridanum TaxID=29053 RepID=UPI0006C961D9|nr:dosage compensation protein dpy-30 [Copidosoma floridanum]XP_014209754.1 dosage compensation protein dpy-30 [Copidosoma floridanum]
MASVGENTTEFKDDTGSTTSIVNVLPDVTQKAIIMDKDPELCSAPPKKSRVEIQSLPPRQYLDQTVVPILLQALSKLAKERPPDPINYLASYLLRNKSLYDSGGSPPTTQ